MRRETFEKVNFIAMAAVLIIMVLAGVVGMYYSVYIHNELVLVGSMATFGLSVPTALATEWILERIIRVR